MKKYWIHRNPGGNSLTKAPDGSEEQLPEDNEEVQAILNPPDLTIEEIYDQSMKTNKALKAFILLLNDGSIEPGTNLSGSILKKKIADKMTLLNG